jgi:hypothetical protein
VETRPAFEDLRQVLSLLAGLLVLEASGSREGAAGHPMLVTARSTFDRAADTIRRARPTPQSTRHHRLLLAGISQLDDSLRATANCWRHGGERTTNEVLVSVRAAYAQLQLAGSELPGFELVALRQGCCGVGTSRPDVINQWTTR